MKASASSVVVADGLDEVPAAPRPRRNVGVTHELRQLELAAVAEGRDWREVEMHRTSPWQADSGCTLEAAFGSNGLVEIRLSAILVRIERAILAEPERLAPHRLHSASGLPARLSPPAVAITGDFTAEPGVMAHLPRGPRAGLGCHPRPGRDGRGRSGHPGRPRSGSCIRRGVRRNSSAINCGKPNALVTVLARYRILPRCCESIRLSSSTRTPVTSLAEITLVAPTPSPTAAVVADMGSAGQNLGGRHGWG